MTGETLPILGYIFLCAAGFLGAFVDSIAGGGGIVTVPAYMAVGLPPHIVLGTNKFAASCGSFTSSLKFIKSGKADFRVLKYTIPFTFIGTVIGVNAVLGVDDSFLNSIVMILILFIGIYTICKKSLGMEENFKGITKKTIFLAILLAIALGFYDGFFGPGTGSFIVFGMINIFGYEFTKASANARVMNFVSNVTALILFALAGQIDYMIGIPVGIFMILGARVGSNLAIKNGAKFIKPIYVVITLLVAFKILLENFIL